MSTCDVVHSAYTNRCSVFLSDGPIEHERVRAALRESEQQCRIRYPSALFADMLEIRPAA